MGKKLGFLSFGHWGRAPGSMIHTARESILATIELAVAAEEVGMDGAWIRVHHFEQNLSSPFALLAAMAARTNRIELGTGVINMRYENPLYLAELAATTDLISGGRLQLGLSRGSPEIASDGPGAFGYPLKRGQLPVEDTHERISLFRSAIAGEGIAPSDPLQTGRVLTLPITPVSPGLSDRIWYGAGNTDSARIVGQKGMNLMSSTLVLEATGESLGTLQARQIAAFREAYAASGHSGTPRVSVSRSILPITTEMDRKHFASGEYGESARGDQIGILDRVRATFGKTYIGEPEQIVASLSQDEGVAAADTILVTVPNLLGVKHNTHTLSVIVKEIAPALGWRD